MRESVNCFYYCILLHKAIITFRILYWICTGLNKNGSSAVCWQRPSKHLTVAFYILKPTNQTKNSSSDATSPVPFMDSELVLSGMACSRSHHVAWWFSQEDNFNARQGINMLLQVGTVYKAEWDKGYFSIFSWSRLILSNWEIKWQIEFNLDHAPWGQKIFNKMMSFELTVSAQEHDVGIVLNDSTDLPFCFILKKWLQV